MRTYAYLPVGIAAVTDLATAWMVLANQPGNYPYRVIMLQLIILLSALLMAFPNKAIRVMAILVLTGGAAVALASIGMFYVPTIIASGWVLVRSERTDSDPGA
jgi:hypothetical protein